MSPEEIVEAFTNNKLWLHITKNDMEYVDELVKIDPTIKWKSGDPFKKKLPDIIGMNSEIWIRCEKGVSYCSTYPRESNCRDVSPWIYDEGPIYDISELVQVEQVTENELDNIFDEGWKVYV